MQLTIRDVSKFLDVSQGTIVRWVKERGLPAQSISGQYRFHRAELLEWATAQGIKVSVQLFDHLETDAEPPPNLVEALEAGGVFYGLEATNKAEAIRALIKVLPLPEATDRELLLGLFLTREANASTGIGDGIAIPHVRNPIVLSVQQPMVILGFLKTAVAFGALDGKPVHVLFSLICPTMRSHLQVLSRLSYALHDARLKEVVMSQGTRAEILQEVRRVEAGLAAPEVEAGKATE